MKPSKGLVFWLVAPWLSFSALGEGALAAAKSWYVDGRVYESGDGTSWEKAFKTIQEGINAAADGDTVTVERWTYQENVQFKGKNIILTGTNPLNTDVIAKTIIQGRQLGPTVTFSGTEEPSCWLTGFTVWDGKAWSGGAILGNGTHATIAMNVITGGTADGYGGGLYECHGLICVNVITVNSSGKGGGGLASCNGTIQFNVISLCWSEYGGALDECDGLIQDNTITDCVASSNGGGLFNCEGDIIHNDIGGCVASGHGGGLSDCDADILDNSISGCVASGAGGGLFACGGEILNNTITNCVAGGGGGGLFACDGDILNNTIAQCSALSGGGLAYCGKDAATGSRIANNKITQNTASGASWLDTGGGGLFCCNGTIENNTITDNSARFGGGLAYCDGLIQDNLIRANRAGKTHTVDRMEGHGGGLAYCDGFIRNNVIADNFALLWEEAMPGVDSMPGDGGGLYVCNGTIENNTVTGNCAEGSGAFGGGVKSCNGTIRNCIIWGNTAENSPQLFESSIPAYSCIEGWSGGGQGNISADPLFADAQSGNLRLRPQSPCIDAGSNEYWMWSATDLDGNVRVVRGTHETRVDMGAYEYGSFRFAIVGVEHESSDHLKLTWSSRPGDTYVITSSTVLDRPDWFQEGTVLSQGATTSFSLNLGPRVRNFYRIEMAH